MVRSYPGDVERGCTDRTSARAGPIADRRQGRADSWNGGGDGSIDMHELVSLRQAEVEKPPVVAIWLLSVRWGG